MQTAQADSAATHFTAHLIITVIPEPGVYQIKLTKVIRNVGGTMQRYSRQHLPLAASIQLWNYKLVWHSHLYIAGAWIFFLDSIQSPTAS